MLDKTIAEFAEWLIAYSVIGIILLIRWAIMKGVKHEGK